jgi:hypothetical protein
VDHFCPPGSVFYDFIFGPVTGNSVTDLVPDSNGSADADREPGSRSRQAPKKGKDEKISCLRVLCWAGGFSWSLNVLCPVGVYANIYDGF